MAVVVTTRSAYESLALSQSSYYASYRFADVFAHAEARARTRWARASRRSPAWRPCRRASSAQVTLDVPGLAEPAIGRLIGVPERRVPILNDLHLRRGRWLEPGRRDEVLVSEAFAEANALAPGDTLGAVLNGRWQRLRIVGVALSPEYVYEIQAAASVPRQPPLRRPLDEPGRARPAVRDGRRLQRRRALARGRARARPR